MSLSVACKFILLISLLLAIEGRPNGADNLSDDEKAKEKACFAKFPLPEASRNKFLDEGGLISENDQKELCYADCILKETFTTEGGMIRPEMMLQEAANSTASPERTARLEKAKAATKTCTSQAADAAGCSKNYKIWRCFDKLVLQDDDSK